MIISGEILKPLVGHLRGEQKKIRNLNTSQRAWPGSLPQAALRARCAGATGRERVLIPPRWHWRDSPGNSVFVPETWGETAVSSLHILIRGDLNHRGLYQNGRGLPLPKHTSTCQSTDVATTHYRGGLVRFFKRKLDLVASRVPIRHSTIF